jgi:hypothetical protein
VVAAEAAVVVVEYAVPTVDRNVASAPENSETPVAFIVTELLRVTVYDATGHATVV